ADYEKAIEDYTKILFLAPNADIYKLRGDARLYLKDYDHAITDYTQAIQLDPNNPNILDGRSTAYTKRKGTGDRELANADRKKAAQLAR
ncbi:MAG: tetratricopeptide repeat protein, partial [Acidobacteria bacterium]|nr:tetratricopeptide repeat protein [Acidobacteriota bacterium]